MPAEAAALDGRVGRRCSPTIKQFPLIVWLYAAVMLSGGLMLCVLTPAFQVPDEPAHFFRAYQVSRGILLGQKFGDTAGGRIPASYFELFAISTPLLDGEKQTVESFSKRWDLRTDGSRISAKFPNTAAYSAFGYLPQAIAISVAGLVTNQVMWHLIVARVANFIFFVLIIAVSMYVFPPGIPAFMFLSGLPMVLFLVASASQDAMIIGASALYTALLLRLLADQSAAVGEIGRPIFQREFLLLGAAGVAALILTLARIPYVFLALMLPAAALLRTDRRLVCTALGLAVLIAVCAAAQLAYDRAIGAIVFEQGAEPTAQIRWVLADPVEFLKHVIDSYCSSPRTLHQMIGVLGWLDTVLPDAAYTVYEIAGCVTGGLLIASAMPIGWDRTPLRGAWRSVAVFGAVVLTAALSLLALSLILYVTSGGEVGASEIPSQGRYFLPYAIFVAPVTAVAFVAESGLFRRGVKWCSRVVEIGNIGLLVGLGASQYFLAWRLLDRYYPALPG